MKLILALPAYNEERALPLVLGNFQRLLESASLDGFAVVIDDGSTDGTAESIRAASAHMRVESERHAVNSGLGQTVFDALRLAASLAAPGDVIVTMDADNTHPVELIPAMLERIAAGNDVVIASRYRAGAAVVGLSAVRHAASWGARAMFELLAPMDGVRDYTCGFRAYRAGILHKALSVYGPALATERGFASMAEILLKIGKLGARFAEVPMVLRYDLKGGVSKMRVGATIAATVRVVLKSRAVEVSCK